MKRMMFRTRLILIFVLALMIQGALIGFFSNYYATEIVMKNKRGDMADMINLVDININAKVRYMTELIDNTASSYTVKNMLSTEQYYDSMMFQNAFISEYFENLDSSFGAVNNVIILKDSKVILNRNADREVAQMCIRDRNQQ